jgi:hypothetical protein
MRAFAEWLSSRRYRSALVATLCGLLPLLSIPSAAVIVLAGLRHGAREALIVLASATLFLMFARALTGGAPMTAVVWSAGIWLPVVGLAELLRRSRSLSLCLQVAVVGLVALALFLYGAGEPVEQVRVALEAARAELGQMLGMELNAQQIAELAATFAAALFGGTLVTLMAGVFLGRWWASLLAQGSFAAEFRQLRMGRVLALAAAGAIVLYAFMRAPALLSVLFIIGAGFLLQGLAVLHAAAATQGLHRAWLVVVYVALLFTAPYAGPVIALVGWLDSWVDLRARMTKGRAPRGNGS